MEDLVWKDGKGQLASHERAGNITHNSTLCVCFPAIFYCFGPRPLIFSNSESSLRPTLLLKWFSFNTARKQMLDNFACWIWNHATCMCFIWFLIRGSKETGISSTSITANPIPDHQVQGISWGKPPPPKKKNVSEFPAEIEGKHQIWLGCILQHILRPHMSDICLELGDWIMDSSPSLRCFWEKDVPLRHCMFCLDYIYIYFI